MYNKLNEAQTTKYFSTFSLLVRDLCVYLFYSFHTVFPKTLSHSFTRDFPSS